MDLYGTGGTVLQNQKQLLEKLTGLRSVELMDLQLDRIDGKSIIFWTTSTFTRQKSGEFKFFFLSFSTLFYTYSILDFILAAHVLDEVIEACGKRLTTLKLVNATRSPFEMLSIVGFVNLKVLMISPHNLGDDLVECMGKYNSTP